MILESPSVAVYGFAAAALVHAVFGVLVLRRHRANTGSGLGSDTLRWVAHSAFAGRAFTVAVLASLAWSLASLVDTLSPYLVTRHVAMAADWLRYGAWLLFLIALVRPHLAVMRGWRRGDMLAWAAGGLWLTGALLIAALAAASADGKVLGAQLAAAVPQVWTLTALAMPVLALLAVEQLFRNLPEAARWNAKPVCLALGMLFVFDVYYYAEAVLFGRFDADASHVRGLVHALAMPLIYVASRRRGDWIGRLQVSRQAAFYSTSLLLVGGYLLFVAGLGYLARALGGDWGRALQLALLSGALLLGLVFVLSGSVQSRVKVFVGKHFFSYRYDYREQWLRFTQMLSAGNASQDLGARVVRGLADMLESPGGCLFMRNAAGSAYVQTARWNVPEVLQPEPASGEFPQYLQRSGWIIDLLEHRTAPKRYGGLSLPSWLAGDNLWVVIPLAVHDELLGWVVLAQPRAPIQMNWETRDLVKTASRQAAGFLAQMQATEALLELRKFEAFNRMSAFVVHDLKNIVTQLSLMLKNAQRLHANPEFQEDMLLTVQSSLDKMKRLMLQLREGATPPGGAAGVALEPLLRRLQAMARGRGRELQLRRLDPLSTRGHEERLERVLGHLVHNAMDATAQGGEVWADVQRESGWVKVKVQDTGTGMSEEFMQTRLFRPFQSTKESGMGIGMHESLQYVRELGGEIDVQSSAGEGTCFTVRLPLFDVQRSDGTGSAEEDAAIAPRRSAA